MPTSSRASLLGEISAARDHERTGALDIEWDGARASLFFTFGQPGHAVFEGDGGRMLVGDDALAALVAELPAEFRVADWRRAMVTEDTLHLSADELVALLQPAHRPEEPVAASQQDAGTPSLVDHPGLLAGLPGQWRGLCAASSLPAAWLRVDGVVDEVRASGGTCALLVDAVQTGAALFEEGELIAVYTTERSLDPTVNNMRGLLGQPGARVTVAREGAEPAAAAPGAETPDAPALADAEALPDEVGATTAPPVTTSPADTEEPRPFVPARLDVDIDGLRGELTDIAVVWLGDDDSARVGRALAATRPGVDDFVTTIATIGAMEIPGHENAVVRAMAREMHYRAAEVLCGI